MVKREKKAPKRLDPGDLIVSSDGSMIGLLRGHTAPDPDKKGNFILNTVLFPADDNPYWYIIWVKAGREGKYHDVLVDHPYRDSELRSEISSGHWTLYCAK